MSEYPNSGVLFRNDRKGNDKAPDFRGEGTVMCDCGKALELELAAWRRQGKKGEFLSVSLKPAGRREARFTTASEYLACNAPVVLEGAKALKATDKGLLVRFADNSEHWIARSQIQNTSEVKQVGDTGRLEVGAWWARKAGIDSTTGAQQRDDGFGL